MVAHRLPTVQRCTSIAAIYRGHVLEQGSHEELLVRGLGGGGSLLRVVICRSKGDIAATFWVSCLLKQDRQITHSRAVHVQGLNRPRSTIPLHRPRTAITGTCGMPHRATEALGMKSCARLPARLTARVQQQKDAAAVQKEAGTYNSASTQVALLARLANVQRGQGLVACPKRETCNNRKQGACTPVLIIFFQKKQLAFPIP